MKRWLCWLLTVVLIFALSGCGKNPSVEKLEEDCAVFAGGDITKIHELVFGNPVDGASATEPVERGFLAELMAMSRVSAVSSGEDYVVVKVTAPDMSDFFRDCSDALDSMTSTEEMKQQILEYAANAQKVSKTLPLETVNDGENLTVRYESPVFVDAMTGGLLQAYCEVLDQMVEQLGG